MTGWCLTKNKLQQPSKINFQCLRLFLSFSLLLGITTSFFIFPQITLPQEGWKTLFQDNLESGNADHWRLDSGWQIEQEDSNFILSGSGHNWARVNTGSNWTDYRFSSRVKLINEGVHLNVRVNNTGRYYIGFNDGGVFLHKQLGNTFFNYLARADFAVSTGQWHIVSITVQGSRIEVAVDGIARIGYTDNATPLLQGTIALETIWDENSHVHFDDINIVGEPPPTPPPPPPLPANWTALFSDGFEGGSAEKWNLGLGWGIEQENSNHILSGEGHHWANPLTDGYKNCVIETKFKLIAGGFHLSFRMFDRRISETERILSRYFLAIREGGISLNKQVGSDFFTLFGDNIDLDQGSWHIVRILLEETSIKVYLDNGLAVEVADNDQPLLFGTFAFETLDNSHIHFDDTIVFTEPPPVPPPGYTWKKTGGPSGGLGYDVRIHPWDKKVMFVTDNPSGVNKSYDAGTTWTQRNSGITTRTGASLDGTPIFSLTIDPNNPNIVWAGTQNAKGIYKSTDGGETWIKKDKGVVEGNEISFRNFGIHPYNSNIVFAGGEIMTGILGKEFDKTKGKIYKTEDGGENWRCVWSGDNLVRFVLFDPTNPNIMYASTGIFDREAYNDVGVGILKSTDGGATWFQINNGIPDSEGNRFAGFLEMHPTNPQILFAASGNNAKGKGGIFRTVNGGESWEKVLSEEGVFTVVTISSSNPKVAYAGTQFAFYRSEDGGNTWQKFFKESEGYWGPPGVTAGFPISAVVDPDNPYIVFANNYGGGNFKSTDGAKTWVNSSKGYTGAHLHAIVIDPVNPAVVYTGGRSGPFKSSDGGRNWIGLAFGSAGQVDGLAVALNPYNPHEVLISNEFEGTIYKTKDGGKSWQIVFDHPEAGQPCIKGPQVCRHGFKAIAYAPSKPNTVYAGMRKDRRSLVGGDFPAGPSFGMYKSTDNGETWMEINNGLKTSLININCIAVHPINPDIVYIGTWKDGVFKTTDGGQSWVMKNNGLASADVRSLAIDPQSPEVVYAGLGDGVGIFKTTNGGELWGEINTGLNLVCPSNLLPAGKVKLGVSFEQPPKRVFSTDYYLVPWTSVWSIVIDPTNSQMIYAGDLSSGVYMSTDGGNNWIPIKEGLSTKAVTAMAISSDGKVLYAATEGEGVFRLGEVSEVIFSPDTPSGPSNGIIGLSYTFTAGGASSNFDHPIQYRFDWDDGIISEWLPLGTTSASHSWNSSGTYLVKVQAACSSDLSVVSAWSGTFSISISSTPIALQSPANGTVFKTCSLITNHQPSFQWNTVETFTQYGVLFSTSPTDFSTPIAKATVNGTQYSWTPSASIWKKIMTSSLNGGSIRDIYWKLIGTTSDKTTAESDVSDLRIGTPQAVTINAPDNGAVLSSGTLPTFDFGTNCNVKFKLEISSLSDFSDSTKIKGFSYSTKDPNSETALHKTLTASQWSSVKKLVGTGTGYFRIKAWDGLNRESVSGVRAFTLQ